MNNTNDLQQTLLELHYGLLDEAEAATWRQRIATDAEVALAWADVLKLRNDVTVAARLLVANELLSTVCRQSTPVVPRLSCGATGQKPDCHQILGRGL